MISKRKLAALAIAGTAGSIAAYHVLRSRRRMDFRGKVVLITGGSRGLGLVLARMFAGEGARLAIMARDQAELARAEHNLLALGAEVLTLPCDVRSRDGVEEAIRKVVEHYGAIDVLINNAGVIQVGPLEHMKQEDFEDAISVHLWGPLYAMQAAIPHMRRQGGGRIVNIASIGGMIAVPHLAPYSASKFALVGLSDAIRAEVARDNILVTTVCPNVMRTGSHLNANFKGRHEAEFTLFSLVGALPTNSTGARRAAWEIVQACRFGDAQLVLSKRARAATTVAHLFPEMTARALALVTRFLPGPTDQSGDASRSGWESRTKLAPSPLTTLLDHATEENNELRDHHSVES
jgi:NAD(P)-dependent dehydrogenase (short-subunit alcohol dehydrogenase family)